MKRFFLLFMTLLALNASEAFAEEVGTVSIDLEYNPNSLHPIPYSEILMRRRIWRHINLQEKHNKPFSPRNKELTLFIIKGVKVGSLIAYSDEEFLQPMSKEEFLENMKVPEADSFSEEDRALSDDDWGDDVASKDSHKKARPDDYFAPNEVSILEVMEDWIFHKVRSVQVYDIQSIKLIIPPGKFETGLRRDVAIFKYKDLAAYFDEEKIVWHNVHNRAADIKMTEAFEQRLFSSRIVKLENPDDNTIADIYNKTPRAAAMASQELEEKLLEEEYFLWTP